MSQDAGAFGHRPVMVDEIVDLLGPVPAGVVLDGTVGGGGHARAILEAHPHLSVLGIDRDADALAAAAETLRPFGSRAQLYQARFDDFPAVADRAGVSWLSAALFDLGVSSWQLDTPERGFSYRASGPLDMRMDAAGDAPTAADVVNTYDEARLARLFADHGERRFARRIARAIVRARPLHTTADLVEAVKVGIPAAARRTGGHPAKRVFQALRVEVNDELEILPGTIDAAIGALAPGGRCIVLAYHSGEDRLVKERFVAAVGGGCTCPHGLPCVCGSASRAVARFAVRGSRKPSPAEVAGNPRAESARLRAVEKLDRQGS
ncbi:MAG TPA: 16S rRNA (cytosine(1402)-N(4))-methyltransferase RsmH [Acidimicrobiales bacterium]|nr:16S rRNA (cytosine(1402)-N(4))-methyltransferase RsmH [Acidimicrobiales bacterium]